MNFSEAELVAETEAIVTMVKPIKPRQAFLCHDWQGSQLISAHHHPSRLSRLIKQQNELATYFPAHPKTYIKRNIKTSYNLFLT